MGIRTPDLLIANETLYQLSYTPNLINFRHLDGNLRSKKDACLYHHEIIGNYYAKKKICSKIKTHALRSEAAFTHHGRWRPAPKSGGAQPPTCT